MRTGKGVTNPKLAKGGRKPKDAKHHSQNLEQNEKKRASRKGTELKVECEKRKCHIGEYAKRCTKPSLGCLKDVFSRK